MSIDRSLLRKIIEGALLASGMPLSVQKIQSLFSPSEAGELDLATTPAEIPEKDEILAVLQDIQADTVDRGFELKELGTGWRFQVVEETAPWIARLWEEKPQKYSRATLETLALIAYRQPITRGDIEAIRGVAVSSQIIKTLTEREWVKVVGHRDVPGRPALYATTREFLDYFNIKNLDQLPSLKEVQNIDDIDAQFNFGDVVNSEAESESAVLQHSANDADMGQSDDPTGDQIFAESEESSASRSNVVPIES